RTPRCESEIEHMGLPGTSYSVVRVSSLAALGTPGFQGSFGHNGSAKPSRGTDGANGRRPSAGLTVGMRLKGVFGCVARRIRMVRVGAQNPPNLRQEVVVRAPQETGRWGSGTRVRDGWAGSDGRTSWKLREREYGRRP